MDDNEGQDKELSPKQAFLDANRRDTENYVGIILHGDEDGIVQDYHIFSSNRLRRKATLGEVCATASRLRYAIPTVRELHLILANAFTIPEGIFWRNAYNNTCAGGRHTGQAFSTATGQLITVPIDTPLDAIFIRRIPIGTSNE